jgi:micrococcal nuclease
LATPTLTPTPFLVDPSELTPNPANFTPRPTFTPQPTPTAASLAISNWCVPWNSVSQVALVQSVIDGATIEIEVDGAPVQVRYIGVELPDVEGSAAFDQATRANRRLVEGKWVTLIKERSDINQQGQWVRYVLAQGVFVNHELIRQGYARANTFPPDISCDVFFFEAQRLAQAAGLGIWAAAATPTRTPIPTPTPQSITGDVRVVFINPRGEGWQDPNEFAEIRNLSTFAVQLSGWTLSDEKGHKFTFPNLLLNSGGYCRIYTNQYVPEACGLSFYSLSAIGVDAGDCAYLREPFGYLVSQVCV